MTPRCILLVEDNPDDEALTRRGLQQAGWSGDIRAARDGAAALDALEQMQPPPALVLLDLKLPKLDGIDVLRRIRENDRTRGLCVVMFTSSSEARDIARCHALGCNGYVVKPMAYDQYLDAVLRISRDWLQPAPALQVQSLPK